MWTGAKPTEIKVLVACERGRGPLRGVSCRACPSHCNPLRGNLLVGRRVVEAVALVLARAGVALPHRGLPIRTRSILAGVFALPLARPKRGVVAAGLAPGISSSQRPLQFPVGLCVPGPSEPPEYSPMPRSLHTSSSTDGIVPKTPLPASQLLATPGPLGNSRASWQSIFRIYQSEDQTYCEPKPGPICSND